MYAFVTGFYNRHTFIENAKYKKNPINLIWKRGKEKPITALQWIDRPGGTLHAYNGMLFYWASDRLLFGFAYTDGEARGSDVDQPDCRSWSSDGVWSRKACAPSYIHTRRWCPRFMTPCLCRPVSHQAGRPHFIWNRVLHQAIYSYCKSISSSARFIWWPVRTESRARPSVVCWLEQKQTHLPPIEARRCCVMACVVWPRTVNGRTN